MIKLKNEYIEAKINDVGAELVSLKNLKTGHDLLWDGTPPFWKYHAPVLFPFVGSLNGKEYRYKGKTYQMRQHGFAREKQFRLFNATDTSVTYVLESDEETKKVYPFDFRLEITQTLDGNRLIVSWKVMNTGEKMYFSIGAHPAFRVPVDADDKKNWCYVLFPEKKHLNYILKDLKSGSADPTEVYTMELDEGFLKIEDHLFDIDTFIFEDGQITKVSLCGSDKKPYVTVHCDGFPYFGLWTQSDLAPFVCLEPWYGRLDDIGFTGELPEKKGMIELGAGEEFRAQYEIEVGF